MSNRPTPPHHKTIAVTSESLANGYGGTRRLHVDGAPGDYIIVAAAPTTEKSPPAPRGMAWVIVAPARGPR